MAAYAALVSLMNTMNHIRIHPRVSTFFNKNQLKSLRGTVVFLLDFIESYNYGGRSGELEDLEAEIASAAHAAEDVIESHLVDQIHAGSNGGVLQKMMIRKKLPKLQKEMEDMDSIKENVGKVEMQGRFKNQTQQAVAASSRPVRKSSMVGFDDYLIHLLDKLTGLPSHQQVIPIIGMGGIGKTTLARNAFDHLLIKQHFNVCAWATISQNYSVKNILLQLHSSREGSDSLEEQQLGEQLHKDLFNRRYLVVLDDMWSIEVWDEIKFFFPDNNNGSRIVLTSRLLDISRHFNSPYLTINLLDEDKSWNLFCQESFGDECCPVELEEVGKKICESCKGLPLSISVIGGFLRKSCKSREYWDGIARDTYSILSSERDNQCINILSLSYNQLPAHLKPCFLYMGIFEEDEDIIVSRLIELWVAEGFLRPNDGQSLEEVGEGYLKDLVEWNLISVKRWGSTGKKIRACNIHDLIRELCLRVAEKERFLCVMNSVGTPRAIHRERCIVIHESMSNHDLGSESLVRSLIRKCHARFNFRLLRVLTGVGGRFLLDDFSSVNLRCLDRLEYMYKSHRCQHIPKKISLLWNLQTVRINGNYERITAPSELWEMVQLRHVQVSKLYVPDPSRNGRVTVLPNLQSLGNALNFRLSGEVCKRIPNVKKLHLVYTESALRCKASSYYCSKNLGRFRMLESLTLRFGVGSWRLMVLRMTFPNSLKKLSLICPDLHWKDLEMIGSLPNLEVFKLWARNMIGSEWNPVEGEFRSLKFLHICGDGHLTKWNADNFHFPVLETLFLVYMDCLDEIPSGIGEILTLRIIRLYSCNASCAFSAVKILEEQESFGNDGLQVQIGFHINDKDTVRFGEMMEEEGFTSNNLHIKFY